MGTPYTPCAFNLPSMMATADVNEAGNILNTIKLSLRNHPQFALLQRRLEPKKRGRPSLQQQERPKLPFDNLLLLQLNQLRQDTGCSLASLQALFAELCVDAGLTKHIVAHLIQTCVYQVKSAIDVNLFLVKKLELGWIGEYSKSCCVTKEFLVCAASSEFQCEPSLQHVSKGLLMELSTFRGRKGYSWNTLLVWLQLLSSQFATEDLVKLKKMVTKVTSEVKSLQRRKGDIGGSKRLQDFKDSSCFPSSASHTTPDNTCLAHSSTTLPSVSHITSDKTSISSSVEVAAPVVVSVGSQCSSEDAQQLEVAQQQLTVAQRELKALREEKSKQDKQVQSLEDEIGEQKKRNCNFKIELHASQTCLTQTKAILAETKHRNVELKRSNLNRRNQRLIEKHEQVTARLKELEELPAKLEHERMQKRSYQKHASRAKSERDRLREELQSSKDVVSQLLDDTDNIHVAPETRTESGYFKDFVAKCIYQLIGEHEVPASRCRQVIKTVSKHFFGVCFGDQDLPGTTTTLRFADQSHSLSRMHAAEEMKRQPFDLHLDGTSKKHKKFVGAQVTLADKKILSLGFDAVAHENAKTVLDLVLDKFYGLAFLNSDESVADQEAEKKALLENLVGVMTDRASTMKCVGRLLDQKKAEEIHNAVGIEFLHCNAHYMLGLSSSAEKALVQVAKDSHLIGELGREKLAVFNTFGNRATEAAVCRYVWMGCDILAPRGDEKHGCQEDWLAYLASIQKSSKLCSFRSNRFNNLFAAAAGLVYHQEDIYNFFQMRQATNLKQQSVLADAKCKLLNAMLLGVALMYVFIAGPFWCFVRSDTHYLDQYNFIQPMHAALKSMIQDPEMLLQEDIPDHLKAVQMKEPAAAVVLEARGKLGADEKRLLVLVLKSMAGEFVAVTERQLQDFLPGGKYGCPPSDADRDRMAHCQLTNLLGEACFADLDYSMFKSRRATLHHHSTINMMKRNHTISSWLDQKSADEQTKLLAKARKLAPGMRVKGRQSELIIMKEHHAWMIQRIKEREEAQTRREERQRKQKAAILLAVSNQGPCKTVEDLCTILSKETSKGGKFKALKAQIDHEKLIMGSCSPLLRTSGIPLAEMCLNFIQFQFQVGELTDELVQACTPTGRKRKRQPAARATSESDPESDPESENDEPHDEFSEPEPTEDDIAAIDFSFKFSQQGQTVAVFYNDEFFVGRVLEIKSPDLAVVTFMSSSKMNNRFKWPESADLDTIKAMFVFDHDFDLLLINRTWKVDDAGWNTLLARWDTYQRQHV